MGRSVIIEGLIASGKTTVATELASVLGPNTLLLLEPADGEENHNPYLDDYYKDPVANSFKMQVFLLETRYGFHQYAENHVLSGKGHAVLDRSLYGDVSFANIQRRLGLMDERDYKTYRRLYKLMTMGVGYPSFCIRLLVSPDVAMERIQKRLKDRIGRECESKIDIEYLKLLDDEIGHTTNFLRKKGVMVLDVPWDAEREDETARSVSVAALRDRIVSARPSDPFRITHSRVV